LAAIGPIATAALVGLGLTLARFRPSLRLRFAMGLRPIGRPRSGVALVVAALTIAVLCR
jgi:hypothetical protein